MLIGSVVLPPTAHFLIRGGLLPAAVNWQDYVAEIEITWVKDDESAADVDQIRGIYLFAYDPATGESPRMGAFVGSDGGGQWGALVCIFFFFWGGAVFSPLLF